MEASTLQGALNKVFGTQQQQAPATPVQQVPGDGQATNNQQRKTQELPAPGGHNHKLRTLASVFDLDHFPD